MTNIYEVIFHNYILKDDYHIDFYEQGKKILQFISFNRKS